MKTIFSILFFFFFLLSVNAQRTLPGKILDSADDSPMIYVNVFLNSNPSRGTFSNADGYFFMQFLEEELTDTLVISQIGYKTVRVPVKELNFGDTMVWNMESSLTELATITVVSDEGLRGIIREAIKRIPQNYGTKKKFYSRAYFREYSISDDAYAEQIEAIVTIKDNAYSNPSRFSKIYLNEFRRSDDQRNLPPHLAKSYTNPFYNAYERMNPVRKRQFHLFAPEANSFLKRFRFFNLGESIDNNQDTLIRIGYEMKNNYSGDEKKVINFFRGEMTINKSDFAIINVRQGGDDKNVFKETIYQKKGNKYFPISIFTSYSFKYQKSTRSYYNAKLLLFFDWKTKSRFNGKKGKRLDRDENVRTMKYKYNESFWSDNPIIKEVPAPRALEADLSKQKALKDQFIDNAKRKH
jgi:hypothetical protein